MTPHPHPNQAHQQAQQPPLMAALRPEVALDVMMAYAQANKVPLQMIQGTAELLLQQMYQQGFFLAVMVPSPGSTYLNSKGMEFAPMNGQRQPAPQRQAPAPQPRPAPQPMPPQYTQPMQAPQVPNFTPVPHQVPQAPAAPHSVPVQAPVAQPGALFPMPPNTPPQSSGVQVHAPQQVPVQAPVSADPFQ